MKTDEDELKVLERLRTEAPPDTMIRLRRRMTIAQAARDLVFKQAWGFWVVVSTFLALFLAPRPSSHEPRNIGHTSSATDDCENEEMSHGRNDANNS